MKRQRVLTGIMVALVLALGRPVQAQRWFNPGNMAMNSAVGGWPLGGGFIGGGGFGGGTAGGSILMGMAQVIRAEGEYNERTTRAAINYEQARGMYIANRRQWTETYFAMRELNQARQLEKLQRTRYSPEILAQAARAGHPRPLSSEALDPVTGKLMWPELLQADLFAPQRERIEQLIELQTTTSGAAHVAPAILEATEEMIAQLRDIIHEVPADDYIFARRFLDSLAYSVRSSA